MTVVRELGRQEPFIHSGALRGWQNAQRIFSIQQGIPPEGLTEEEIASLVRQVRDFLSPTLYHSLEQDPVVVTPAQVQEVVVRARTSQQLWAAEASSWVIDPGHPDKGKKYAFSLYCARQALKRKFPTWQRDLLPSLLENFDQSVFAMHAYTALKALKDMEDSLDPIRNQYAFILYHIRNALEQASYMPRDSLLLQQSLPLLLEFCYCRFTSVSMYPLCDDFLCKALRSPQEEPKGAYEMPHFSFPTLAQDIQDANERLKTIPPEYRQAFVAQEVKKWREAIGCGFDAIGGSNIPWVHSLQEAHIKGERKSCLVLRHGTPTCDPGLLEILMGGVYRPRVTAEYKAYLEAHPEKQTLYVNIQEHDDGRSRVVRQLEKSYPNFHFLALPMNGLLEAVSTEQLKQNVLSSLIWPKALVMNEHVAQVRAIADQVHALYFDGKELDSPSSRKTFISLLHSELKDYFKNCLKIDVIVSAGKENRDLDVASVAIDMIKNGVKLGLENDPNVLREIFVSTLASPFIVRNESVSTVGLDLLLHVIRHLVGLSDEQRKRIRETPPVTGYEIQKQTIPKEETSWAQMVGSSHFLACIKYMKVLREKRVVVDPDFRSALAATYLHGNSWNLEALQRQLKRDMPACDIRLNGERMLQFETLCNRLHLKETLFQQKSVEDSSLSQEERNGLRFMALLQQGAAAESMRDAATYFDGNAKGLVVAQRSPAHCPPSVYPTRIYGRYLPEEGVNELTVEQDLELRAPEREGYPIDAKVTVIGDEPAKISWEFAV